MQKISLGILILLFLITGFTGSSLAETKSAIFDENSQYDIYLCGQVIRSVKILRQTEINQKIFLVIAISDSNLSGNQGYVKLDSVSAILPVARFRVEDTGQPAQLYYPKER